MSHYRLYAIISKEALKKLNGNRGKMCVQTGHAFLHSLWNAEKNFPEDAEEYKNNTAFKMTLVVENQKELEELYHKYKEISGTTLVEETGSKTDGSIDENAKGIFCIGIGPIHQDKIQDDIKKLKPFL